MAATDPFQSQLDAAAAALQAGRPAAAEPVYREILARVPDHGIALHFLGICLAQTGRAGEGLALMARSLQPLGGQTRFRYNYAMMLAQAGDLASAEQQLGEAATADPRNVAVHEYLGVIRQMRGRAAAAVEAYRAAAALAPPGAQLLNNLGSALKDTGDADGAIACFRRAVALDARHALAWFNLAVTLRGRGDDAGALGALREAVRADPQSALAWQQLAQMYADVRFDRWDADAARLFGQALAQPAVDLQPLAPAIASLALRDPELAPVIANAASAADGAWLAPDALQRIARPLLLGLLEHALVTDPALEHFLRTLRGALLQAWHEGRLAPSAALAPLLSALAQQCFRNEYVWIETPAETEAVAALEPETTRETAGHAAALFACFRPLGAVAGFAPPATAVAAYASLWRRQIAEPAEEGRLRAALPRLTPIDDDTSLAVRGQYEANPYPRWHRLSATLAAPYPVRQALQALFPHLDPARLVLPDAPDILIAGCGTGFQAAVAAARNPRARILAIDLSAASLAYAARRCRELGLANVEFAQADLLRLGGPGRRFAVIECVGVLHHLRDPLAGWRALRRLLAPGGVMKIGLYSAAARRGVVAARELAAEQRLGGDLASVREMRRLVLAAPAGHPVRALVDSVDFHTASGARDLMLHVQEHRFTLSQIAAALARLELELLGFELDQPGVFAAYRERFPDDPLALSLDRWGRFESDHPHVFAGMYQFWAASPN